MNARTQFLAALLLVAAPPLRAQGFVVGLSAGSVQIHDGTSANRFTGPGFGATAEWTHGRLGVQAEIMRSRLTPADTGRSALTALQFDARASYRIRQGLEAEVGFGRRSISPEFATQDVGVVRIGIRSEGRLGGLAGAWARGALLPVVRFNGGGSSGTALEVGFGTWVSLARGRVRVQLDYGLQRVDRTVVGAALPLQCSTTKIGAALRL